MLFEKLNLSQYDIVVLRNKPSDLEIPFEYEEDDIRMDCLINFILNEHDLSDFIHYVHSLPQDQKRPLYILYPNNSEITKDIIMNKIKKDERFFNPTLMSLNEDFSILSLRYKNS